MNLLGLHDVESVAIAVPDTWVLHTTALSDNPTPIDYLPEFSWITRLNWTYGSPGTLPAPDQYQMFSQRVAQYVSASHGCTRWQIGNEPNLSREWPNGQPIFPWHYAGCYKLCRQAIHALPGHEKDEVLIAASGPWNAELKYEGNSTGDWIKYFTDVLDILDDDWDGVSLHAYTHGYDVSLVTSTSRMDAPFQNRYYNFRTYQDYCTAIKKSQRHKPCYITEANGNGWWKAVGLMPAMLAEINNWNLITSPMIRSVIFYRYPHYDDFFIEGKNDVIAEYREAAQKGYKVPETFLPSVQQPEGPTAIVTASGGANIRIGPGLSYKKLGAVELGTELPIVGRSADSSWLQVQSAYGKSWVSILVVASVSIQGVPVILVTVPISETPTALADSNWQKSYDFVLRMEGGFSTDALDPGNYRPDGSFGGTKYGISARQYPTLDIEHLSREQALSIYERDYWQPSGASQLPFPLSMAVFDQAVNGGVGSARQLLNQSGKSFNSFMAARMRWYTEIDSFDRYGRAWIRRLSDLMIEAEKSA